MLHWQSLESLVQVGSVPMGLAQVLRVCNDVWNAHVLSGALAVSQAVIPHMAKQRSGKIINVGSGEPVSFGCWLVGCQAASVN